MKKQKHIKKGQSFLKVLEQKQKEGYLVSESIALINSCNGISNKKYEEMFGFKKISIEE